MKTVISHDLTLKNTVTTLHMHVKKGTGFTFVIRCDIWYGLQHDPINGPVGCDTNTLKAFLVHLKMKILSFAHPRVLSNLYDLLYCVKD